MPGAVRRRSRCQSASASCRPEPGAAGRPPQAGQRSETGSKKGSAAQSVVGYMRPTVPALACAATLAIPSSALADKTIEAKTVWQFDASTYMLDTGEKLTFKNDDAASPGPHNVTSNDKGPDGKPLFSSQTIKNGEQSPVNGATALKAGRYDFICTIHPIMMATLVVTDRGQPAPPQPPASEPPPASNPPGDTTAPKVRSSLRKTSLRKALRSKRIVASITSDESSTLDVSLVARIGKRTVTVGRARGSGRNVQLAVPLTAAGRRALRGARSARLTLYVEARDAAGNLTTTKASRLLRR